MTLLERFHNWRMDWRLRQLDKRVHRLERRYSNEGRPYPSLQAFIDGKVKPFMDRTEKKQ